MSMEARCRTRTRSIDRPEPRNHWVVAALAAIWALAAVPAAHADGGPFIVHRYHNADAGYVNAYVVETAANAVVVDTGFGERDGLAIRAMVDRIDKPVAAILLTHAHIDHYTGVGYIVGTEIPVISSAGVRRQFETWDSIYAERLPLPDNRRGPDQILADGSAIEIDGVSFQLHEAGPGESYDDVWWMVDGGGAQAAFVGDLAMYGIPPFAQSGQTTGWLRTLDRLHDQLDPQVAVYLGHDSRPDTVDWGPFDRAILRDQANDLRAFRDAVATLANGEPALPADGIEAVTEAMAGRAVDPNYGFLTALTANIVAAELALDASKAAMEDQLRAVLRHLNE